MPTNGMRKVLRAAFAEALRQVPEALKAEGFGVLTEIDVQQTLRQKLGAELRPYRIFGACNPSFAFEALKLDPDAGVMMPCNVALYEDDQGRAVVVAVDPARALAAAAAPALQALASTISAKLSRVLERLD